MAAVGWRGLPANTAGEVEDAVRRVFLPTDACPAHPPAPGPDVPPVSLAGGHQAAGEVVFAERNNGDTFGFRLGRTRSPGSGIFGAVLRQQGLKFSTEIILRPGRNDHGLVVITNSLPSFVETAVSGPGCAQPVPDHHRDRLEAGDAIEACCPSPVQHYFADRGLRRGCRSLLDSRRDGHSVDRRDQFVERVRIAGTGERTYRGGPVVLRMDGARHADRLVEAGESDVSACLARNLTTSAGDQRKVFADGRLTQLPVKVQLRLAFGRDAARGDDQRGFPEMLFQMLAFRLDVARVEIDEQDARRDYVGGLCRTGRGDGRRHGEQPAPGGHGLGSQSGALRGDVDDRRIGTEGPLGVAATFADLAKGDIPVQASIHDFGEGLDRFGIDLWNRGEVRLGVHLPAPPPRRALFSKAMMSASR